jgi:hypothetical protein
VPKRHSLKVKLNQILRVRQEVKVIVNLEVMPKKRHQRLKKLLTILQKLRKELMLKLRKRQTLKKMFNKVLI